MTRPDKCVIVSRVHRVTRPDKFVIVSRVHRVTRPDKFVIVSLVNRVTRPDSCTTGAIPKRQGPDPRNGSSRYTQGAEPIIG